MNREALTASLKAAAYGLVALLGANAAMDIIQSVLTDIKNDQWSGPGSR